MSFNLESLVKKLPHKEKMELLQKINESLSFYDDKSENTFPQPNKQERNTIIYKEYRKLSFFTRILLKIKQIFTLRSREQVFTQYKLNELKKQVKNSNSKLTGFETRDISREAALIIYDFYFDFYFLRRIFQALWKSPRLIESAVVLYLEEKIPHVKCELPEFIQPEELEKHFRKHFDMKKLQGLIVKNMKAYLAEIHDTIYENVREEMFAFYYFRPISEFPFDELFLKFGVAVGNERLDKYPPFKNASAMVLLNHFVQLYKSLYSLSRISTENSFWEGFFTDLKKSLSEDEKVQWDSMDPQALSRDVEKARMSAIRLGSRLPLKNIIRYFKQDPFYRLEFSLPSLNLKKFYHSALRIKLMAQFNDIFPKLRENVFNQIINEIFDDMPLRFLDHYKKIDDSSDARVPQFFYGKALHYIFNYVVLFYNEQVHPLFMHLIENEFRDNKVLLNLTLSHLSNFHELQRQINALDSSLSPDSADGKTLRQVRLSSSVTAAQKRMLRVISNKMNSDAKTIIKQGQEVCSSLKHVLEQFLEKAEEEKASVQEDFIFHGEKFSLQTVCHKQAEEFHGFNLLLDYLQEKDLKVYYH